MTEKKRKFPRSIRRLLNKAQTLWSSVERGNIRNQRAVMRVIGHIGIQVKAWGR